MGQHKYKDSDFSCYPTLFQPVIYGRVVCRENAFIIKNIENASLIYLHLSKDETTDER